MLGADGRLLALLLRHLQAQRQRRHLIAIPRRPRPAWVQKVVQALCHRIPCRCLATWSINRINLDYPGLYPLLALAFGLVAFGLAAVLGGSGFLAVYIAGIVLGSSSIVFRRGIISFHDATAWLGQIVLFVMLGLLSFPSRLLAVAWEGLLIALVLILVALPLAVWASALPFQFKRRELTFLSWVGLKGAVPITLATFPLLAGVPNSGQIFNAVFFVVLLSALTQGWSLPLVARWLHIGRPADPTPALSVEINALRQVDGEILDYTVKARTHVAGQRLRDLALPDGVVVSLIVLGREVVMPGDHVFVAMRIRLEPLINRLFEPDPEPPELPVDLALSFHAAATVEQLLGFYGLPLPTELAGHAAAASLRSLLEKSTLPGELSIGALQIKAGADPKHITVSCTGR